MIKRVFIAFVALSVLCIGLMPTLLSTSWGNDLIKARINSDINGTVDFQSAHFSWFGAQRIEKLTVKDKKEIELLNMDAFVTDTTPFGYFFSGRLGPTTIVNLNGHIEQAANGKTNIQYALEPKGKTEDLNDTNPVRVDLRDVNADFSNQILKLSGKTSQGGREGLFNVEWDTSKDLRFITANIQNLPVALLDQFTARMNPAYSGLMTALLGEVINFRAQTSDDQILLSINSKNVSANLTGIISGDVLTVKTPETLSLVVTPELVNIFTVDNILDKPAKLVIALDQLSIPLSGYGKKMDVQFHIDRQSDPAFVDYFGDTKVAVQTEQGKEPRFIVNSLVFQADMLVNLEKKRADGTLLLKPDVNLPFSADWSGKLLALSLKGNELNGTIAYVTEADITADLKFNKFPIAKACDIFCPDTQLQKQTRAVIGEHIDGAIQFKMDQWDGYARADLQGENGKIHANGRLTHGVLTLNDPFTAQINVTQELGAVVLSEAFPILSGILGSEDVVSLQVPPEGTQIQLTPFSPQNINIGNSVLKLGKLSISSQGDLGEILNLLAKSTTDKIVVWFTPLYFNMQQGQINIGRMDMLIMDEYPIATWGKVNFPKDKVQMMIGFTPRAIEKAFKIEGLPADYLLQIELKGTVDNASINRSKALAKISSLIASTQGVEGVLVGTVIDIASGSLSEPTPPAPTTTPLPWETASTRKAETAPAKKKSLQSKILEKINPL